MNDKTTSVSNENPAVSLSYKDAGVDIDAGNALVDRIKKVARATHRPEVLGGLGGFGALCSIPKKYREPVLVSGTDGVGTKLRLAMDLGLHQTIGIDLVAMCVNDLIVGGAEPLFFLDYFATGKLNVETASAVVSGIGEGCKMAGCALVGGETAEMPGMYQGEDYDLAGFCVGVVERSEIIDGTQVREGDQLIALASSGPHSNGYSLIRKIIEHCGANLHDRFQDSTLGETLIKPTRIYVKPLLALFEKLPVKALSHITGGGFTENIPRVLPQKLAASIDLQSWQMPAIFTWLQTQGNVTKDEMLRTFNCGAGMILVVAPQHLDRAINELTAAGEVAWRIGQIVKQPTDSPQVLYSNSV